MYEYISGKVDELTPTYVIIDVSGVGYLLNISLFTYEKALATNLSKFYTYFAVKEDSQKLFGFASKMERELFTQLISVSGIGTNTARLVLSSLSPGEIINAILTDNVPVIKSVKGVGPKTAQRLVIDLKDKVVTLGAEAEIFEGKSNTSQDEALSALMALGFNKMVANKTISKIVKETPTASVEELIKRALKQL